MRPSDPMAILARQEGALLYYRVDPVTGMSVSPDSKNWNLCEEKTLIGSRLNKVTKYQLRYENKTLVEFSHGTTKYRVDINHLTISSSDVGQGAILAKIDEMDHLIEKSMDKKKLALKNEEILRQTKKAVARRHMEIMRERVHLAKLKELEEAQKINPDVGSFA